MKTRANKKRAPVSIPADSELGTWIRSRRSAAASLWAFRSDGMFVLLGTDVEIKSADACALADFIRKPDAAGVVK